MTWCPRCRHDDYWHMQRREDEPTQLVFGVCLMCCCNYMEVTSYER